MTTTPDPRTVREIARKHIQSGRTDVGTTVVKHFGSGALSDEEFWAWEYAVEDERRKAKVTVSWPDEPPQGERDDSFAMVAEGAPAGPARNVANHWHSYATAIAPGAKSPEWTAIAQVTASILAAMNAEQDERDERDSNVQAAKRKPVDIGTGMPATTHLEAFGQSLRDAFGTVPYHVGSSIHGKSWRDVDVRVMLDDDRFDALFPGYADYRQRDAWWALVCSAISELGKQRTGLPIDFQVQRTTEANEKFPGARNPLFVGHSEEGHRPTMVADAAPQQPARNGAE